MDGHRGIFGRRGDAQLAHFTIARCADARSVGRHLATTDKAAQYVSADVDVHVLLKPKTPEQATLRVTLVYAGDIIDDASSVEASREAVEYWRTIARGWNVDVEVTEATYLAADLRRQGHRMPRTLKRSPRRPASVV